MWHVDVGLLLFWVSLVFPFELNVWFVCLKDYGDLFWFTEGYCWTRTGERQARRMRARYLKAVLRQDVAYFDLQVASIAEVVTSVSNDSLVIQDFLSEKVPCCNNFMD